jgi:DNA-directed RNA polymerase subunit L
MQAEIINSSSNEVNLSVTDADIATLYIVQNELLKGTGVDFAGVIVKHPLTNECWIKINSSKNNPLKEMTKATESAIKIAENLNKLFKSKIKVN